jgi:predicted peptidase
MSIPGGPPALSPGEPAREFPPPQTGTPEDKLRERKLSEQDVLNVVDIVSEEYTITPGRTYLMGHSMGGFGTWYLGDKYLDRWAAIAPMSGINQALEIDVSKLSQIPVLVAVGEQEVPTVVDSKKAVAALTEAGGEVVYVEIAGGSHVSMVPESTAKILEFFSQH